MGVSNPSLCGHPCPATVHLRDGSFKPVPVWTPLPCHGCHCTPESWGEMGVSNPSLCGHPCPATVHLRDGSFKPVPVWTPLPCHGCHCTPESWGEMVVSNPSLCGHPCPAMGATVHLRVGERWEFQTRPCVDTPALPWAPLYT